MSPRPDGPMHEVTGLVADTVAASREDGPGNRFVVIVQGCNFDCVACPNPETIPEVVVAGTGPRPVHRRVADVLDELRAAASDLDGVTVSGGEATRQPAFVEALFTAVKQDPELQHLTCLVDTNGACDVEVWERLAPVLDGAMVDLKCLDPLLHWELTGKPNGRVLATIRHLAEAGLLHEVRLVLVRGVNDDPALLAETGRWLADIDRSMRVRLIGFRSDGVRPHDPPLTGPTPEAMALAAATLDEIAAFDIGVV